MRRYWTIKDIQVMTEFYYCVENKKIANYLNRSVSSIQNQANKLGLKKQINKGCFKKGADPWNKGKAVDIGGKETRFKKGHWPATADPNEISIQVIDGNKYKMIKCKEARRGREFLHKKLWIEKYGPVPHGFILRCKGDTLNESPENWECISRAENLKKCRENVNHSRAMKFAWMKRKARRSNETKQT